MYTTCAKLSLFSFQLFLNFAIIVDVNSVLLEFTLLIVWVLVSHHSSLGRSSDVHGLTYFAPLLSIILVVTSYVVGVSESFITSCEYDPNCVLHERHLSILSFVYNVCCPVE